MTVTGLPLFDALSRRTDPPSSRQAAQSLRASGQLGKQLAEVLAALETHGPCTSKELAQRSGIDRYVTARRLADLLRLAKVPTRGEVIWRGA